ncbi:hypothetical protein [Helicobacter saguini]|uniref:Uncharacterized protein n=1 Tax=Helicobacter saguini TaxID=1548018 RepID=A0A6B0HM72_9HELI|nr:hypothetical protein [Helicobacter saguini]MWV60959.1 hypothetical protein [Helicobacter saguini]MWV70163.1 hypothetical protein [Helicobacter saguini]MWV72066.1 hypothetical protein [Helicobacter saguini]
MSGYNQRIHASLGFDVRISENYAFYLKAIGRYYGLQDSKSVVLDAAANTSISYPAANSYSVMLELGVKGI